MSSHLDIVLVLLAVGIAAGYLLWRKLRMARQVGRDWSTGHAEVCDSCVLIEIQRARRRAKPLRHPSTD